MPPPPEPQWEDITTEFKELHTKLPNELMVSVAGFDLVRVMHTVEAMDPKMDPSLGYESRLTLREVLESGRVNTTPNDEQILALMKYLFKAEGCFLNGFFLPSNMFTCIYFHRRALVEGNPLLDAYIRALGVSIHCITRIVQKGDVAEEEEFVSLLFGVDCSELVTPAEAAAELEQTLAELKQRERLSLGDDFASEEERALRERTVRDEMAFFFEHRINWLKATAHLDTRQLKKAGNALKQMQEKLKKALKSIFPVSKPDDVAATSKDPLLQGIVFEEAKSWLVHFVSNPQVFPTLHETLQIFDRVADEQRELCLIEERCKNLTSVLEFTEAFSARKPSPHVVSRSRLMVLLYENHLILKKYDMQDLIVRHLSEELGAPLYAQLIADPLTVTNYAGMEIVDAKGKDAYTGATPVGGPVPHRDQLVSFLHVLQNNLLSYLYALVHNRARMRRRVSNLLGEWAYAQSVAWDCDKACFDGALILDKNVPEEVGQRTIVLSSMVYDLVLKLMETYISLGFELELFSNTSTEIKDMLWYVEYIGLLSSENLKILMKTNGLEPKAMQGLKKYKNIKSSDPARVLPPVYSTRTPCRPPEFMLAPGELVKKGLLRICVALAETNILRDTGSRAKREKYLSKATRFNRRLAPFLQLMKPQFIGYDTYITHTSAKRPALDLLEDARQNFEKAEGYIAFLENRVKTFTPKERAEFDTVKKVAKANQVSLKLGIKAAVEGAVQLMEASDAPEDVVPAPRAYFDFCYSNLLPVVKLKKA